MSKLERRLTTLPFGVVGAWSAGSAGRGEGGGEELEVLLRDMGTRGAS